MLSEVVDGQARFGTFGDIETEIDEMIAAYGEEDDDDEAWNDEDWS